jgi:REP element-mobilizing transposase RayT
MARPLRITYPGAFYHVTSRGNERKAVFKSVRDREKFLEYLESATERYNAVIHVYCLMDNHYHLLLETPSGNLSKIMAHINGAYTTYFNTKRQRSGHLFQGRFKAILVEADEYAKELSRYIHLNPVRAKMCELPEDYNWSSYLSYIGKEKVPIWLKRDFILGFFGKKLSDAQKGYREFVEKLCGQEYESPIKEAVGTAILGSEVFVDHIRETFLVERKPDKDVPELTAFRQKITIEDIENEVRRVIKDNEKLSRNMQIYLSHKLTGGKFDSIGKHFDLSASGVCKTAGRFIQRIQDDRKMKKTIDKIEGNLSKVKV